MHLNYNQLTGTIPISLANARNLEDLWLDHNQLSGKVPEEFYFTSWWPNTWGSVVVGNNLDFSNATFPGPDITMDVEIIGDGKFSLSDEYAKNEYTILFQWSASCQYLDSSVELLLDLYSEYSNRGLKIIGRSYMESSTFHAIESYDMPWETYFSQQLDYPTYLVPTITVIDREGMVVFSDLIQDRSDLPKFVKDLFTE